MKAFACWAVAICGLVSARPAVAQWGGATSPAQMAPGQNSGMNPYGNPFMNPYANPYYYNTPKGAMGASMVFMTGQQAMAQAAQQRAMRGQPREAARHAARGAMNQPGGNAARFFGGGSTPAGPMDEVPNGRFQRQGRYFRPNGD